MLRQKADTENAGVEQWKVDSKGTSSELSTLLDPLRSCGQKLSVATGKGIQGMTWSIDNDDDATQTN